MHQKIVNRSINIVPYESHFSLIVRNVRLLSGVSFEWVVIWSANDIDALHCVFQMEFSFLVTIRINWGVLNLILNCVWSVQSYYKYNSSLTSVCIYFE